MPRAFGWYVFFFQWSVVPLLVSGLLEVHKSTNKLTVLFFLLAPSYLYSAEAVASMIKAHIFGKSWEAPAWLPKRYLTWATEA